MNGAAVIPLPVAVISSVFASAWSRSAIRSAGVLQPDVQPRERAAEIDGKAADGELRIAIEGQALESAPQENPKAEQLEGVEEGVCSG